MVLGDRLRYVMVLEEYEDGDACETINDDKYQKEFIFKLFQLCCLGGGVC